jgi:hypothetical protein
VGGVCWEEFVSGRSLLGGVCEWEEFARGAVAFYIVAVSERSV